MTRPENSDRYSIEIKNMATGTVVLFTATDLTVLNCARRSHSSCGWPESLPRWRRKCGMSSAAELAARHLVRSLHGKIGGRPEWQCLRDVALEVGIDEQAAVEAAELAQHKGWLERRLDFVSLTDAGRRAVVARRQRRFDQPCQFPLKQ